MMKYEIQKMASKDIYDVLSKIHNYDFEIIPKNKKVKYYNIPVAFDIETTSYLYKNEKVGVMYIWTFGIFGYYFTGRTWDEFLETLEVINNAFCLNNSTRLVIYVHNLNFDIQFFRKLIKWNDMLIDNKRSILYALYKGIEFRCSYRLSNYSLQTVAKNLHKYKASKMVGDLDYSKIRNEKTVLTDIELNYCYYDVIIIMNYIQELIEQYGSIASLPLTQTGFVRQLLKEHCFRSDEIANTKRLTSCITINDFNEYEFIKSVYAGAIVTANPKEIGLINYNVASIDIESSYIYSLICFPYPCSKFKNVTINSLEQFNYYCNNFICIFSIKFYDLEAIDNYIYTISESKCYDLKDSKKLNGKVYQAKELSININNIDFDTISLFYKWSKIEITNLRVCNKSYLPKQFIMTLLDLYFDKTTLKGVAGKEVEYMQKKARLNSIYGDCVTDIVRNQIKYEDDDFKLIEYSEEDKEELIKNYNKKLRYNSYIWGVIDTSISKYNLLSMVYNIKEDFLYTDTDSIKFKNFELYKDIIDKYNKNCEKRLLNVLNYYKIDLKYLHPIDSKGIPHTLGSFTREEDYLQFKTLGSKRYMYQYASGDYSFTIAGLNKNLAMPYLLDKAKSQHKNVLDLFTDEMYIPKGFAGRRTHTYVDYEIEGYITDFQHHKCKFKSPSSVYLEEGDFTLNLESNMIDLVIDNLYEEY